MCVAVVILGRRILFRDTRAKIEGDVRPFSDKAACHLWWIDLDDCGPTVLTVRKGLSRALNQLVYRVRSTTHSCESRPSPSPAPLVCARVIRVTVGNCGPWLIDKRQVLVGQPRLPQTINLQQPGLIPMRAQTDPIRYLVSTKVIQCNRPKEAVFGRISRQNPLEEQRTRKFIIKSQEIIWIPSALRTPILTIS